ncbi:Mov34/MPN/PAD-1 family protein [Burkholderia multivorans]|uniref:Mov34/MPN/PAD-1 family protein n=1 Tax=Burkholderia multivorans TaxID=87883 RepID=UPI0009BE4A5B|nr:Mov34/MPN/PAD-1 family protein [Burkholderia multivorans]MCA8458073.1 Mov34/MPN/PAD-1 family protein [Burkholderia multivorans]
MRFTLPRAEWALVLEDSALRTLYSRVQNDRRCTESVGQLYSPSLSSSEVVVRIATVLKPKSASRASVVIDRALADSERSTMFDAGMHCIGMWHTHPEPRPYPSSADIKLAEDYAQAACRVGLAGIVFMIAGTAAFPEGLYVGVHDGEKMHHALPILSTLGE